MKKICSMIFSVVMVLVCSLPVYATKTEQNSINRDAAIAEAEEYLENIPEEAFGGYYFDEQGQLVINIVNNAETYGANEMTVDDFNLVRIEKVQYSLAELEAMKDVFEPYMVEYGIATLDANEVTNTIDIQVYHEEDAILELIDGMDIVDKEIVNVSILQTNISSLMAYAPPEKIPEEFEDMYKNDETESRIASTVTVYPGMVISFDVNLVTSDLKTYATSGPRKNSTSFYSTGHAIEGLILKPDVYNWNWAYKLGAVTSSVWSTSGDNCIIRTSGSGALPAENKFASGTGRYTLSTDYAVGDLIEGWGGYSGIVTGKILATNQTVTYGGVTVRGLVYTNLQCQQGDSGGAVFTRNASSDTSAKCYGVLACGDFLYEDDEISIGAYFSPIE